MAPVDAEWANAMVFDGEAKDRLEIDKAGWFMGAAEAKR